MAKNTQTQYSKIEVCRNCQGDGRKRDNITGAWHTCEVCGGSGMVRKHVEVQITIEPHKRR